MQWVGLPASTVGGLGSIPGVGTNISKAGPGRKTGLVISMDAILNYKSEDTEDYYTLLGCDELSSVEQILAEFKVRALECHPDKHPENSKAVEAFQKLQKAKDILTNEASRARYDHWRRSQMSMSFQQWEALSDSVKMVGFSLG
ncbi:dnaJ homolog subfamily C member 12 isoform X2 [Dama dama]|uniref:dnaJ homolog subfamily C member 12 isoform X2 n=1 Tax=Dama dama TaxID=30532 RepID=UPI002A35A020|nr:dnaJ homolog subfamily C member 12 isoform X2 [Dama dama]